MKIVIALQDRSVNIEISPLAWTILNNRESPLGVEMELYFSCLLRKKVRFYEQYQTDLVDDEITVNDKLQVRFNAVMTESCSVESTLTPPLVAFPIARIKPYVPRWLRIGYKNNT